MTMPDDLLDALEKLKTLLDLYATGKGGDDEEYI